MELRTEEAVNRHIIILVPHVLFLFLFSLLLFLFDNSKNMYLCTFNSDNVLYCTRGEQVQKKDRKDNLNIKRRKGGEGERDRVWLKFAYHGDVYKL